MPELPAVRRTRLVSAYALTPGDAVMLTQVAPGLDAYFEEVVGAGADARLAKNWLVGPVLASMNDAGETDAAKLRARLLPAQLARLLALIENGTISGSIGRDVFAKMFASGRTADVIVEAEGLTQIDDESQVLEIIADVLARHADAVAQYRGGKTATFGFLVGQVMKATAGKANPKRVNELLKKELEARGAGGAG